MNSRRFLNFAAVLGVAAACLAIAFSGGSSERQAASDTFAVMAAAWCDSTPFRISKC